MTQSHLVFYFNEMNSLVNVGTISKHYDTSSEFMGELILRAFCGTQKTISVVFMGFYKSVCDVVHEEHRRVYLYFIGGKHTLISSQNKRMYRSCMCHGTNVRKKANIICWQPLLRIEMVKIMWSCTTYTFWWEFLFFSRWVDSITTYTWK